MGDEKKYIQLDEHGIAPESGWVKSWGYSENGEFYRQFDQWVAIGTGVAAWSTTTPPPATDNGQVAVFSNGKWSVVPDHSGETVYSTKDQTVSTVALFGDYPAGTTPLKPMTKYDKWDGQKWVTDTDAQHKGDVSDAEKQKLALLTEANTFTGPWQTQLLLGIISDTDKASLIIWMKYYQQVQAVDTSKAPAITWPTKPA
ncbi:hypothetical protein CBW58_01895 [Yersinia frederiksenii]|nr:hypothetical protein CBW58_01895 [Yersinia frederiksenii]